MVKETALQETLWFESDVEESIVLIAGRPVPVPHEPVKRGEGVAIVLAGPAIPAWHAAGGQWKVWSSQAGFCKTPTPRVVLLCSNASGQQGEESVLSGATAGTVSNSNR